MLHHLRSPVKAKGTVAANNQSDAIWAIAQMADNHTSTDGHHHRYKD